MHNRLTEELAVCGLNAVKTLGEVHPERIRRLFLREERMPLFSRLCKNLAEWKRPYKICDDEELERICKTCHHQGIAAMIQEPLVPPAAPEDIEAWCAGRKTGILLCNMGNDLNLGAVVRSAAFFDVSPVILTENRRIPSPPPGEESPPEETPCFLSTGAYRTAEGGMEYVEFRSVRSPAAFLRSTSRSLVSIGTDPRARIRIKDLPGLLKNESGSPRGVILVIGNEETGLPKEIKDLCSITARIPGTGAIESLNAAQAAALFMQELYER